jgi:hypothetical protein
MQLSGERETLEEIKKGIIDISNRFGKNPNGVPEFPIHVFPGKLKDTIENVSISYGIDKSFLASSILFSFSISIGNTHVIQLKKGQFEKSVLYLSFVARPSSNKSAALKFAISPIQEIESKLWKEFQESKSEFDQWKETPRKERLIQHMEEPHLIQYLLNESTMEATCMSHQSNRRGLAIHRDEIAGLFKDFNKYRSGSDLENFLSNWSGGSIKINRVSRSPIFISDAFISVAGTIQPTVLREMTKDFLKSGAGFIDRFLFVYPEKQEKAKYTDNEANPELIQIYKDNLIKVFNLKYEEDINANSKPTIVEYMEDARAKVFQWLNEVNKPRVDSSNDLMAGIYGKFDIHFQRICLILHFIKWSYGLTEGRERISLETVNETIQIIDFFIAHTEKVQGELNQIDPKVILEDHELKLYNALPEEFDRKKGEEIAEKFGKKKSAFYNFLNENSELFIKEKQGLWKKNIS